MKTPSLVAPTLFSLLALAPFAGYADLPYTVADFDAAKPESHAFAHGGKAADFSEKQIAVAKLPLGAPERRVYSAPEMVRVRFARLDTTAKIEVRVTFFVEQARTVNLFAGTTPLLVDEKLPAHTRVVKTLAVPASAYADGSLRLALTSSGGDPVVTRIEVLSDKAGSLKPEPATAALLATQELPMPRLSPRPKTVAGVSAPKLSLDGEWRFAPAADAPEKAIVVPGEWAMQGFVVKAGEAAVYRREATLPADWAGRRVKLRFDAVSAECVVRVNGREVGAHAGGFVPFELDVTEVVKPGANAVEVLVKSETAADKFATMSQYAAHPVGGLLRSVSLFALPEVNLAAVDTVTTFDAAYRDAVLTVHAELANESGVPADAEVVASLLDPSGKPVAIAAPVAAVSGIPARGARLAKIEIPVPAARAWDTEHPNLYTLELAVRRAGETLATTTRRVGLRTVAVDGPLLRVNGKPVKLLGACRHEIHPLTGRSLSAADCRRDAEIFRAGNANFLRTSHYPPSEAFLDACDELGIFVESEAAICWVKHHANANWQKWDYEDPALFKAIGTANLDNIVANRSHPSVVMWSQANESRWSSVFERVDQTVRRADASRPTAFHDQCWGGFNNAGSKAMVANFHYPAENGPAQAGKDNSRPTVFGEYAHVQCYNRREWHTDPFVRSDWGRVLRRMVDKMHAEPNNLGGSIWAAIDDMFHLPAAIGGDIVGYGPWGVIDGWRREKPEYTGMKNAYARIRVTSPAEFKDGAWTIKVRNLYDFTNLNEVGITWRCGDQAGTVKADAAPRGDGLVVIRPAKSPAAGEPLRVAFTDPRGFLVLEQEFGAKTQRSSVAAHARTPVAFSETDSAFAATSGDLALSVDRKTGALVLKGAGGKSLLAGLPVPMTLELNNSGGASGPAGSIFTNDLQPFTPVDPVWAATSVRLAAKSDAATRIEVDGKNKDAEGTLGITLADDGTVRFDYAVKSLRDANVRQRGLAFAFPRAFDTLKWTRASEEASFDPNDIARKYGVAKANPSASPLVYQPRVRPTGTWASDASPLGTNDFRSTKGGILEAGLSDASGFGFIVESDGSQSVRAWVDGDLVRFLVADYNTGGCDGFFNCHYTGKERQHIKKGDALKGAVVLRPTTK